MPLEPARTTVVMVTRDRREQTLGSLRHLHELNDGTPVIVVDNGSSDGTADAVATQFPGVRLLRSGRNLGALGRNLGVAAAATEYVAFADDDSWWAPGALIDAAKLFHTAPRLGLLACHIVVEPSGETDPVCELMAGSPLPRSPDLPGPSILGFVACGTVIRRSAFLETGGFHPLIPFGGEEAVVALDLAAAGWGLAYTDGITAYHHPLPHAARAGRQRLIVRNALLTAWLRRPLALALRRTLTATVDADDAQRRGGARDAWLGIPQALRHRRPVPRWLERQLQALEGSSLKKSDV